MIEIEGFTGAFGGGLSTHPDTNQDGPEHRIHDGKHMSPE
jgi:hypothetical protein